MKQYSMGTYKVVRDKEGRFTSIWKSIKWFFKKVLMLGFIVGAVYVAFLVGVNKPPVIKEVVADTGIPPILTRIAKCESPTGHFKNGKVVFSRNTNGTTDIGKFQINTIWLPQAAELGLNLAIENDNEAMAEWIYANRGTGDWSSSANCWRK